MVKHITYVTYWMDLLPKLPMDQYCVCIYILCLCKISWLTEPLPKDKKIYYYILVVKQKHDLRV